MPPHLEEDLVRLVLAEQLDGVAVTIQKEARCESNREVNTCVPSWACAALQAHTPYICGITAVPKMNRHVLGGGRDKYVSAGRWRRCVSANAFRTWASGKVRPSSARRGLCVLQVCVYVDLAVVALEKP